MSIKIRRRSSPGPFLHHHLTQRATGRAHRLPYTVVLGHPSGVIIGHSCDLSVDTGPFLFGISPRPSLVFDFASAQCLSLCSLLPTLLFPGLARMNLGRSADDWVCRSGHGRSSAVIVATFWIAFALHPLTSLRWRPALYARRHPFRDDRPVSRWVLDLPQHLPGPRSG